MAPPTIELRVADVRTAVPAGAGVEAGLVVLEEVDPPGRMLRMIIGQPEARAIYGPWKGIEPPRPTTWDLFVSTIELLGGAVREVVITSVEEQRHFFATMELVQGDASHVVACRPSDAFALALRSSGARIVTTEEVMGAASVLADGSPAAGAVAEEAPAVPSRRMVAAARRVPKNPAPEVEEPAELGTEPAELGTEPAELAIEPAELATEPAELATEPAGSEAESSAVEPAASAEEPAESEAELADSATLPADDADLTA